MVTHMKTTIELSDALLRAAKRSARARGVTLRAIVEEGLRRVLREAVSRRRPGIERFDIVLRLRRRCESPLLHELGAEANGLLDALLHSEAR